MLGALLRFRSIPSVILFTVTIAFCALQNSRLSKETRLCHSIVCYYCQHDTIPNFSPIHFFVSQVELVGNGPLDRLAKGTSNALLFSHFYKVSRVSRWLVASQRSTFTDIS